MVDVCGHLKLRREVSNMGALDGLVVLDLSRLLAGPFCTQLLSDLGATVWKIESPWGDDTRRWGPPFVQGESAYYLSANRGKKSVVINLKDSRGQELIRELAARADIFIENFKAGDLVRYGLDYERLRNLNPRLIYSSITGYGQTGPRASEPGYDAAMQGMTGIMSVTGAPDGSPMKVGVAWIDMLTGLMSAIGILSALHEREQSNQGQHIDLSLFDVGLMSMVNLAQSYLASGVAPERMGTAHPQVAPYQVFETNDSNFMLAVGNDEQYRRMTEAIEHRELWEDERFQTNAGRVERREELAAKLAEIFKGKSKKELLETFERAGVPVSPINNLAEALHDPQAQARHSLWEVAHPALGNITLMANPLQHMSRTPAEAQSHPPLLGEHTSEVLTEVLNISPSELNALEESKVVVCGTKVG